MGKKMEYSIWKKRMVILHRSLVDRLKNEGDSMDYKEYSRLYDISRLCVVLSLPDNRSITSLDKLFDILVNDPVLSYWRDKTKDRFDRFTIKILRDRLLELFAYDRTLGLISENNLILHREDIPAELILDHYTAPKLTNSTDVDTSNRSNETGEAISKKVSQSEEHGEGYDVAEHIYHEWSESDDD